MADYQYINTNIWNDSFMLDLTPEEKFFYVYLLTCERGNIIGAFELPVKIIELQTGYNRESIEKLIARFVGYGKIIYDQASKEICLVNWLRHNGNTSEKLTKRYLELFNSIKSLEIKEKIASVASSIGLPFCKNTYPIDTLSIPHTYPSHTTDTTQTLHNTDKNTCASSEASAEAPPPVGGVPADAETHATPLNDETGLPPAGAVADDPPDNPPVADHGKLNPQTLVDLYNQRCRSLPKAKILSDSRKQALRNRWRQAGKELGRYNPADPDAGVAWWTKFFAAVEESDFLTGRSEKGFVAGFDWILQQKNFVKIVEGNYRNREAS